jgi:HlyD family secretion protein
MKKRTIIIIIIIALLGAVAFWYFTYSKKEKPISLITQKPQYGYISTSVMATGTVQPVDTVAVGTQVSGTISKIFVDFNSVVKKGELLAQLDQSLFLAQVDQIEANLQQARNNLAYQQQNFTRQTQLYNAGALSKADYETAENSYKTANDNVNAVAAQLRSAQKNLSFTDIYSPIDGTVLSRNISVGQTVAASFSTPTLFSIAQDLKKMQVRASVDEADIGNVKFGERVTFTVDAFPNDTFNGTVEEIRLQPVISANVVTYTTIIDAPNDDLKLKPGMTANITIYTKEEPNALLIPAGAVNFNPDPSLSKNYIVIPADTAHHRNGSGENTQQSTIDTSRVHHYKKTDSTYYYKRALVWLQRGDTLYQKRITTGLDDDIHIEVIHGLTPNDSLITGVETTAEAQATSSQGESSPFMPHRPSQKPNNGTSSGAARRPQ